MIFCWHNNVNIVLKLVHLHPLSWSASLASEAIEPCGGMGSTYLATAKHLTTLTVEAVKIFSKPGAVGFFSATDFYQ